MSAPNLAMNRQPPGESSRALKVFIVEDAINMQVAVQDLVCSVADSEVVGVVGSEDAAIEWAESHEQGWDLAIVDLTLEQGDGFKIVRHLGGKQARGVVVVFSAFVTDVIRRHCIALGADAVFHKTESSQLARYVEDLTASPQAS